MRGKQGHCGVTAARSLARSLGRSLQYSNWKMLKKKKKTKSAFHNYSQSDNYYTSYGEKERKREREREKRKEGEREKVGKRKKKREAFEREKERNCLIPETYFFAIFNFRNATTIIGKENGKFEI